MKSMTTTTMMMSATTTTNVGAGVAESSLEHNQEQHELEPPFLNPDDDDGHDGDASMMDSFDDTGDFSSSSSMF